MSKKQMTLIYYHVPQDKDDPQCPNVFGVPYNKATLRLAHIYEAFPLKGTYLFRFKYSCEGQIVWLDLPDIEAKLPTFKEKVYMKATRVSWNDSKLNSHYRQKTTTTSVNIQSAPTVPAPIKKNNIDFFEAPQVEKKVEVKSPSPAPKPQNAYYGGGSLLQSNNHSNLLENVPAVAKSSPSSSGLDFLGNASLPNAPKKQVNLMQGFQKHGDLI